MGRLTYYETAVRNSKFEKVIFDEDNIKSIDKAIIRWSDIINIENTLNEKDLREVKEQIQLNTVKLFRILNVAKHTIAKYYKLRYSKIGKVYIVCDLPRYTINSTGEGIDIVNNSIRVNIYRYIADKPNQKLETIYIDRTMYSHGIYGLGHLINNKYLSNIKYDIIRDIMTHIEGDDTNDS